MRPGDKFAWPNKFLNFLTQQDCRCKAAGIATGGSRLWTFHLQPVAVEQSAGLLLEERHHYARGASRGDPDAWHAAKLNHHGKNENHKEERESANSSVTLRTPEHLVLARHSVPRAQKAQRGEH